MLEVLKKLGGGAGRSAKDALDELQLVVTMAREEGSALSAMLKRVDGQAAKLTQLDKALQEVSARATSMGSKIEEIGSRLNTVDLKSTQFEATEARTPSLVTAVEEAEKAAQKLLAPDGELQKHRHAVQQLSAQALQTTASFETLRKEQAVLDELREPFRQAQAAVRESTDRTEGLRSDFDQLRGVAQQLAQDYSKLKESGRETRENTDAAGEAVREIEKRLGTLATLQEQSTGTEERVTALNALAEHVSQKIKALENQKHTVEYAVVESNRLNELVWNMDVQIARLNEGSRQMARTEESIERMEKVTRETTALLESALKSKEAFAQDVERLGRERNQLVDFVRTYLERLQTEKKEFDVFDQRVRGLQATLGEIEKSVEGLSARERNVAGDVSERLKQVEGLAEELSRSATHKDELIEELVRVQSRQRDVAAHMEASDEQLRRLETVLKQLEQRRSQLAFTERKIAAFEGRLDDLRVMAEEVERTIQSITAREGYVDAIRKQVEAVHEVSARSRADLVYVSEHRAEVGTLRERVDEILARAAETEERLAIIEARKKLVDEVQARTGTIVNVLEDVRVNLELVSEQKAVIDHVVEQITRLDEMVQASQATLKALQAERELAERIERGIKQLRSQAGTSETVRRLA